MRAESEVIYKALIKGFREGIPSCSGQATMAAVEKTYGILAEVGGRQLVGDTTTLAPGTFWPSFQLPAC
jgi:NitT/TauT family transport system substrate-binding protein